MLVHAVMTRSVVTAEPDQTLHAAASVMRRERFRHLPVVRNGRMLGIISDREATGDNDTPINQVMRTQVISVSPDTPVEVAAALMAENKIGALPVVDPRTDSLVGIVSQTDLFATLARLLGSQAPGTRLAFHLRDLPHQLVVLGSAAEHHRVSINNLIAFSTDNTVPAEHEIVLRVGTIDARAFVDELRRAGIVMSSVDEP